MHRQRAGSRGRRGRGSSSIRADAGRRGGIRPGPRHGPGAIGLVDGVIVEADADAAPRRCRGPGVVAVQGVIDRDRQGGFAGIRFQQPVPVHRHAVHHRQHVYRGGAGIGAGKVQVGVAGALRPGPDRHIGQGVQHHHFHPVKHAQGQCAPRPQIRGHIPDPGDIRPQHRGRGGHYPIRRTDQGPVHPIARSRGEIQLGRRDDAVQIGPSNPICGMDVHEISR